MANRTDGATERRCPNCGAWMSPTSVSCDLCGTVVGRTAPLTSDGGSFMDTPEPTAPSTYDAPPGLGAPPAYGAQPTAPPEYGALPGVGAPPEYGAPPGVGAPPEYGAPPPYLPPGGYGSPPGYGGARPGGFAPGYGQRTNDKATLALILGIVGLVICQIASVFAIVIGGKALREIQYSGGTESGEGMAKAGRILGWIGVCIFVLAIIAIFGLGLLGHTTRSVYTPVPTGN